MAERLLADDLRGALVADAHDLRDLADAHAGFDGLADEIVALALGLGDAHVSQLRADGEALLVPCLGGGHVASLLATPAAVNSQPLGSG